MYKKTLFEKALMCTILIVVGFVILVAITIIEHSFMQGMKSIFLFHFIKMMMFSFMFTFLFLLKKYINRVILKKKIKSEKDSKIKPQ